MPDLQDGESVEMQGSARLPYILKNVGGVYSCSCAAWRNQSLPIERRTCKHLKKWRGDDAEQQRIGGEVGSKPIAKAKTAKQVPALLLAESWDGQQDIADWWLSEKLDGVRAWWDGTRREFRSRQGNVYHAPAWFTGDLPATSLDGELWLARKQFQRTFSIVRRHDATDQWRQITFRVFDAPGVVAPFEDRHEFIRECLSEHFCPYAEQLEQQRCRSVLHLQSELERITALGGEGLMLREPGSRYEAGRSSTLLKVKQMHDAEARVIEHLPGAGRHKGRLGALLVALADGTQFSVGTGFTDAQRENPPPVGSTITFRYQELTDRGVPRFPSFVRVHSILP